MFEPKALSACLASRVVLAASLVASCTGPAPRVTAENWPEADALFHSDPRWLGADGAYSVDLGRGRFLWLFGDTFLAREPGGTSSDALFLRNTLAVQTGPDPSRAFMEFSWGVDENGAPRSFVPEDGEDWFWPGGGARVGEALVIFYARIQTPSGDPSGFEAVDWRALVVDDPDDDPSDWVVHDAKLPPHRGDIRPGAAVLVADDHLYGYAETGDSTHDVYVSRWTTTNAAAGDLSSPEWWCGGEWSTSCADGPAVVMPEAASELSVQGGGTLAPYIAVESEGYGATTLALRTAPALEGPWSDPESFFRPPESRDGETNVYAGKGHPGLGGADLVATYVAADLYYPRFVRVNIR